MAAARWTKPVKWVEAIVSDGEAVGVLGPGEAPLDTIAVLAGGGFARDDDPAAAVGWDDRHGLHIGDDRASGIAVIGFFGEHGVIGLTIEEGRRLGDIVDLSGGYDEAQGSAKFVGECGFLRQAQDRLGRRFALGNAQRLIAASFRPPPAGERSLPGSFSTDKENDICCIPDAALRNRMLRHYFSACQPYRRPWRDRSSRTVWINERLVRLESAGRSC